MIIDHDLCDICGTCVAVCAADAIRVSEFLVTIEKEICTNCGACLQVCPIKAIREGNDG